MICPYYPTPFLFFFSSEVPTLLYYSHIPILIISLIIGIYILIKDNYSARNTALATPLFLFAIWLLLDLVTWTSNSSDNIMFVWSFFGILFILINFFFLRFLYFFIENKDIPFWITLTIFILFLPVLLLSFTSFNLTGFDTILCASLEGNYFLYYYYFVGVLIFLYACFFVVKNLLKAEKKEKTKILLIGFGTISFLFFFFSTGFLGSFLKYLGLTVDYQIEQYGFFPIIIFMILLSDAVVSYKIFNIKLLAIKILAFGLVCFVGSQFFFIKVPINFVLNGITFIASIIFSYFLVKSVKKEIEQREHIEGLNISLRDLIKQRESLVHLVTHKVKGSFTRTKFIFAGILDGTFGQISPEIKKVAEQGLEFDNGGIQTVDLVLNVANMQNGLIKYDMKQIDFKDIVLQTINDKKLGIENKGLKLETEIRPARPHDGSGAGGDGSYNMTGDAFWLKEVINNLIENSIKYTREGTITVTLENENEKIKLTVKDTGMGIDEEDKKNLFTEGGRGKDSVKVNVDSTGYGLYTVKLIVDAHKGTVSAQSEGPGKGSQFYVELPIA